MIQFQTEQAKQSAEVLKTQARQTESVLKSGAPQAGVRPAAEGQKVSNFAKCLDAVLVHEGGFSEHPDDPGGATNLGITIGVLREWRRGEVVTVEDVKKLTRDDVREIYRTRYCNVLKCDDLPSGVDLVVFDFGVNAGPSRSAKILQKVIGAEADGSIGPVTVGACKAMPVKDIITKMSEARMEHYQSLPHWPTFKNGWTNRTKAIESLALTMA